MGQAVCGAGGHLQRAGPALQRTAGPAADMTSVNRKAPAACTAAKAHAYQWLLAATSDPSIMNWPEVQQSSACI